MSTPLRTPSPVTGFTVADEAAAGAGREALADEAAALTRAAYTGSDPLPGLPPPDGSFESAADVLADLAAGARLWMARDLAGNAVAALRTLASGPPGAPEAAGTPGAVAWEVRRVSVLPAWKGRGLTRVLLDTVQRAASRAGAHVLRLDAVVERCLPALYAHLGFRPVYVFQVDDKPMTEWRMERRHDGTAPPPPAPVTPAGLHLSWYVAGGRLLAGFHQAAPTAHTPPVRPVAPAAPVGADVLSAVVPARAHPGLPAGARLAGVDVLPDPAPGDLAALVRHLAPCAKIADGLYALGHTRTEASFHLMPRSHEPRLMSLTRRAPGRELPLDRPAPTGNE